MPRSCSQRLPKPSDPGDERCSRTSASIGFHAKHVRPYRTRSTRRTRSSARIPIYDIGFSYTVGLRTATTTRSSCSSVDLPDDRAHDILWEVVRLIEGGASFAPGDESGLILHELPARFGPVSAVAARNC